MNERRGKTCYSKMDEDLIKLEPLNYFFKGKRSPAIGVLIQYRILLRSLGIKGIVQVCSYDIA